MRLKLNIAVVAVAFGLLSFSVHKFYVSVTQVTYSEKRKELQLISRVFIDDLEKVLEKQAQQKLYLATSKEHPQTATLLATYLKQNCQIKINGKTKPLQFLTHETEDDVLLLYLTVPATEKIKNLSFHFPLLTDTFNDQQNILHITYNGNKKSLLLTRDNPQGSIEY